MSSKHALNNTAPQDFDGAESQDVVVVNAVDEDHGKLRSKNSKADLKQTSGENVPSTEEGSADVNTAQDGDGPAKDVQPPKVVCALRSMFVAPSSTYVLRTHKHLEHTRACQVYIRVHKSADS